MSGSLEYFAEPTQTSLFPARVSWRLPSGRVKRDSLVVASVVSFRQAACNQPHGERKVLAAETIELNGGQCLELTKLKHFLIR
jgi:hypothetical protein